MGGPDHSSPSSSLATREPNEHEFCPRSGDRCTGARPCGHDGAHAPCLMLPRGAWPPCRIKQFARWHAYRNPAGGGLCKSAVVHRRQKITNRESKGGWDTGPCPIWDSFYCQIPCLCLLLARLVSTHADAFLYGHVHANGNADGHKRQPRAAQGSTVLFYKSGPVRHLWAVGLKQLGEPSPIAPREVYGCTQL